MANIILLSCVKTQRNKKTTVRDLYQGAFFKKSLEYAESLNPDKIFVLSSKYGLLTLDEERQPYDVALKEMPANEQKRRFYSKESRKRMPRKTRFSVYARKVCSKAFQKTVALQTR
jgi:hypothetical protein